MVRAISGRPVPARAGLLTDRRVVPLPVRRRSGRPPAAGWLAPVFQLRPTPVRPVPFGPDAA